MFSAILSALGGQFISAFFNAAQADIQAYFNKQISLEELHTRLVSHALDTARDIEVSHADTLAKTYASFMDAVKTSRIMQQTWAMVVLSQTFVLLWYQWFVPVMVTAHLVDRFASAGMTVEWAYLLLGGLMGMGPMVLRAGPGKGDLVERVKAAVGGK